MPSPAADLTPAPQATFESNVGLTWLNRIGAITLLVGIAFAFKTAADSGWLGPAARVGLGLAAAIAALIGADLADRRDHKVFAHGITGAGLVALYLALWAACSLYHLIDAPLAFVGMAATTMTAGLLAMRYRARAIAYLALAGGYATPVLLATGASHVGLFLGYLALLQTGGLALSRAGRWRDLEALTALGTGALMIGWWTVAGTGDDRALATAAIAVYVGQLAFARTLAVWHGAQLVAALLIVAIWPDLAIVLPLLVALAAAGLVVAAIRDPGSSVPWTAGVMWLAIGIAIADHHPTDPTRAAAFITIGFALVTAWLAWNHGRRARPVNELDVVLVVGNPAAYAVALWLVAGDTHRAYFGAIAVMLAAVHLGLAKLLWRQAPRAAWPALGVATTLFVLAVPVQFGGFTVTIAWAVEGVAAAYLAARYGGRLWTTAACVVLPLAALRLLAIDAQLDHFLPADPVFANARFVAFAATTASWFCGARLLRARGLEIPFRVIAHVLAIATLGVELVSWSLRAFAGADQLAAASVAVSLLVTIYAIALIIAGVVRRAVPDRILGLSLIGLVIAKLYLSDVWSLTRGPRIAAFIALGALLLGVSYLYSRYRTTIERLWRDAA